MILNISLTVIDMNLDSSLILDFFILDLLSFRAFSFVGSPELVDIVKQKSGFRWHLSEFLLFLFVFLLLNITWHLSILLFLLGLGSLGKLLHLFLHWVWLLLILLRASWLLKLGKWWLTILSPPWLVVVFWGFLASPVGNWVNHIVDGNPHIWSDLL